MDTPERTEEGWLIVDSRRMPGDVRPPYCDDNWYRGPYWVYSVRGTKIRLEEQLSDGIGDLWNRLEDTMRAAGLTGTFELTGDSVKGLGYRRIMNVMTDAELAELKRQAEESAALYPDDGLGYE
jgi:hypothetical protein